MDHLLELELHVHLAVRSSLSFGHYFFSAELLHTFDQQNAPQQVQACADAGRGIASTVHSGGPDPNAALRLLLRHDRLPDAARLAMSYLDAWDLEVGMYHLSGLLSSLLMLKWEWD